VREKKKIREREEGRGAYSEGIGGEARDHEVSLVTAATEKKRAQL